ncbi:hypothetical protein KIW84_013421 [Lathyrus oleraceus]|nr:hypothetical protein KIW84_032167 [Pisum sativum]KAI5426639.1 hypothetical protein KIW84_032169 [Pisum sativum]KAI5445153.1 hypothetical protein KIW84_013419 [Pisum sativum]KAI5445155.1 hypothetical protein KIW84_013421 [Pisum sativum]
MIFIERRGLPLTPESLATLPPFASISFNTDDANEGNCKPEVTCDNPIQNLSITTQPQQNSRQTSNRTEPLGVTAQLMDSNNNHKKPWDWHGEDYCLQNAIPNFDISEELWNDVPQNRENLSYMFDAETTPIKACGDLAYSVNNADSNSRYIQKEQLEDGRETSQVKRRRMLQFDSQESDNSLSNNSSSTCQGKPLRLLLHR